MQKEIHRNNLSKINTIEPKQRTMSNTMWQQLEEILNNTQIERNTWKTMLFKAM
jgi:hypothetical protein